MIFILEESYGSNYSSTEYIFNNFTFNETGLYKICVYGAAAIKGGKGGFVCGKYYFEINETLYYGLGGREAGGEAGINCGVSKGKWTNGAGRAYANCTNGFEIVAGGGSGDSEHGSKGGNIEEDGYGVYGGGGANTTNGGKKGDPDPDKTDDKYAKPGIKDKGGKGGNSTESGRSCGGGGGDGYYGGGGGCFGADHDHEGGGGGGSNYYSDNVTSPFEAINKYNYTGITISRIISHNN